MNFLYFFTTQSYTLIRLFLHFCACFLERKSKQNAPTVYQIAHLGIFTSYTNQIIDLYASIIRLRIKLIFMQFSGIKN
jgi:hypothetical protein